MSSMFVYISASERVLSKLWSHPATLTEINRIKENYEREDDGESEREEDIL